MEFTLFVVFHMSWKLILT